MPDISQRLARIEARDAIRQLAFKYALAIDMRDMDAIVNLYVKDVRVTKELSGRQALKDVFDRVLRQFTTSVHFVGNHIIEFDGEDTAHGLVYSRCEHEIGDKWCPMMLYYLDRYQRVDGVWYFKRRAVSELYVTDMQDRPVGSNKMRWPGRPDHEGTWHKHFPSWDDFWANPEGGKDPVAAPPEAEKFLDTIRRGSRHVIPQDYSWAQRKD